MDKSARISSAQINHRIFAYLLDLLSISISTALIFVFILYLIFGPMGYNEKKSKVNDIIEQYNLNLTKGLDYKEYEVVLQDFYFNKYSEEIKNSYNSKYNTDYTIIHIYNIEVLNLPQNPTITSTYKTELYQYIQNNDGTFNVDALGIKIEGSGSTYEKNMSDLFYNSYDDLSSYLEDFNIEYYNLVVETNSKEAYSRIIAILISIIIFYIIIPSISKYKSTLFEQQFKIAKTNKNNGYTISILKVILRTIILFLIPVIGFIIFNKYSFIILTIGYLFVNILVLLLSKGNKDIPDKLLRIESSSITMSLIFKNSDEEDKYLNSSEGKNINEKSFLDKLEKIDNIVINENMDEK